MGTFGVFVAQDIILGVIFSTIPTYLCHLSLHDPTAIQNAFPSPLWWKVTPMLSLTYSDSSEDSRTRLHIRTRISLDGDTLRIVAAQVSHTPLIGSTVCSGSAGCGICALTDYHVGVGANSVTLGVGQAYAILIGGAEEIRVAFYGLNAPSAGRLLGRGAVSGGSGLGYGRCGGRLGEGERSLNGDYDGVWDENSCGG